MSGYVTTTRQTPRVRSNGYHYQDGVVDLSGDYDIRANPQQSTTSYRSGRTEIVDPKDSDLEFNPSSYKEAFAYYKKDFKDSERKILGDTGHTFSSTKQDIEFNSLILDLSNASGTIKYRGPLVPPLTSGGSPLYPTASLLNTAWYQTSSILKTAPTNPAANITQFLGELKFDHPPHKLGAEMERRGNFFRSLGKEYINLEFGWKPFVSDVKDILNAVVKANKVIAQYERDSGKIVRRGCDFPLISSSGSITTSSAGIKVEDPISRTGFVGGTFPTSSLVKASGATLTDHTVTTTRTWFRGAYSYHLPTGQAWWDKMKRFEDRANHLLGTEFTPSTLWELSPWSWLVDWNVNIGDNLRVASLLQTDGLVIRWGYLMQTINCVRTRTVSNQLVNIHGTAVTAPPFHAKHITIRKERIKASPYGFGSNPVSYTDRQWSILGALGMIKAPKSLF